MSDLSWSRSSPWEWPAAFPGDGYHHHPPVHRGIVEGRRCPAAGRRLAASSEYPVRLHSSRQRAGVGPIMKSTP